MRRLLTTVAAVAAAISIPAAARAQSAMPSITLVHGLPGTTVDLVVDGTIVLDAFAPGSTVDITSFAGRTLVDVELVDDATGDTVVGPIASVEIPAEGTWSLVAHLDATGTAKLSTFEDLRTATTGEDARLTLRHTADVGAIDLVIGDQRLVTNASNGATAAVELPAGTLIDASIAATGGDPIFDITNVSLVTGYETTVYLVGSADDDTLGVVTRAVELPTDSAAAATTTTSTTTTSTTTTSVVASEAPTGVATGSPIDGRSTTTLLMVALGGLALAGGSFVARRRT